RKRSPAAPVRSAAPEWPMTAAAAQQAETPAEAPPTSSPERSSGLSRFRRRRRSSAISYHLPVLQSECAFRLDSHLENTCVPALHSRSQRLGSPLCPGYQKAVPP